MFNKRMQEEIDELHNTIHYAIEHFSSKVAKLESIIAKSSLVQEYKDADDFEDTLYMLGGKLYELKKGK